MHADNIPLDGRTILIIGVGGFIYANFAKRLLTGYQTCRVVGVDSITEYYDVRLKYERLDELK